MSDMQHEKEAKGSDRVPTDLPSFELTSFFPYLVRVLYADIVQALSEVYRQDYDMMPAEWRVMAILGSAGIGLQASEITERSSMDKVMVSRAVKRMERRGFLVRRANDMDGRSQLLQLSEEGRVVFEDLGPKLLGVERRMLKGLDKQDITAFLSVAERIRENLASDTIEERD